MNSELAKDELIEELREVSQQIKAGRSDQERLIKKRRKLITKLVKTYQYPVTQVAGVAQLHRQRIYQELDAG